MVKEEEEKRRKRMRAGERKGEEKREDSREEDRRARGEDIWRKFEERRVRRDREKRETW